MKYIKGSYFAYTNEELVCVVEFHNGFRVYGTCAYLDVDTPQDTKLLEYLAEKNAMEKVDELIRFYEHCFMHGYPYQTHDSDITKGMD